MNSKSNLIYALAAVTSLSLGLGIAFYRAASENHALMRTSHATEMALGVAQDEAKALREKLQRETNARGYAETAQAAAERAQHATREKLAQETKAHEAAEAARVRVAAELEATVLDLASSRHAVQVSEKALMKAETALQTANAQLAQTEEARQSIETAWQSAQNTVITVTAQLNDQISARKTAEAALASAEDQVRLLNAKLTPGAPAKREAAPVGPLSAIEAAPAGAKERRAQRTATKTSQLAPAANRNHIITIAVSSGRSPSSRGAKARSNTETAKHTRVARRLQHPNGASR